MKAYDRVLTVPNQSHFIMSMSYHAMQYVPDMCRSRLFSLSKRSRSYLRPFVLALGLVRKNNTVLVPCRSRSYFMSIFVFFVIYSRKDLSSHLQIIDFQSCQENQFFTGGASPEPPAELLTFWLRYC